METMKSKQKRPKKEVYLVPWISKTEWDIVKDNLLSGKLEDQIASLNRICAWKSRCYPEIPTGIEVTELLLHARIKDTMAESIPCPQFDLVSIVAIYSLALIRFINLVIEGNKKMSTRETPIHTIAEQSGIPLWLVEIRHQATHSNLPSLSTLRTGYQLAMTWIKKNYWEEQSEQMSDHVQLDTRNGDEINDVLMEYDAMWNLESPKKIWEMLQKRIVSCLTHHEDEFINHLIRRLIKDETPSGFDWVIPWCPILKLVSRTGNMSIFLKQMIKMLVVCKEDDENLNRLQEWISLILTAMQPKDSKFRSDQVCELDFLKNSTVNWKLVLNTVLKNRSERSAGFFPLLLEILRSITTSKHCDRLARLFSIINDPINLVETSSMNYFTLEDLKLLKNRLKPKKTNRKWELCQDVCEWRKLPIGLLPDQFGSSTITNFDLDRQVDSLYEHKVPGNPAERLCESMTLDHNLEDIRAFGEPNLEDRLQLARHSVQKVTAWTEDELKSVRANLVIF